MTLQRSRIMSSAADPAAAAAQFEAVRQRSGALAAPLSSEDAMLQSMEDASPAKWHLAHTTWFFERFVLATQPGYRQYQPDWDYLFNSYYQTAGPIHARPRRGLLSRPSLQEVLDYRAAIDQRLHACLLAGTLQTHELQVLLLGMHHEQQHQELLLTDIKHAFWSNPLQPPYRSDLPQSRAASAAAPLRWISREESITEIGAAPWPQAAEFAYDNESPRHRVLVAAHALANRPISNSEFRAFIDDGGYRTPELWLSDGWTLLRTQEWRHPLYWHPDLEHEFTLAGWRELDPHAPVCHLSYFEADAFARWAGARLPTEAEWEQSAAGVEASGNFVEWDLLHTHSQTGAEAGIQQMFGDVWEWTSSAYASYPGFRSLPGSLGEYNGKFMCGQYVLRGGSCATPGEHIRASYRNFFPPPARWQFSGVRLAKDLP